MRVDALDDTGTAPVSEPQQVAAGGGFAVGAELAGRYRIVRFLGEGGMGQVYAAEDRVLDAVVALKTVKAGGEPSHRAVERLVRELAVARRVSHPNVCRLHDVGEHGGRAFLTMELLDGDTLADRLRAGALPLPLFEAIASQLVAAMEALHARGVVHRDFKSGNVMLVGEGASLRAVVTDFGLARSAGGDDARLTSEGAMAGTPAYMAPEQVEGRAATAASDIYALGIVLFEMATGSLPFREDSALATATARLTRAAPRARSRRPDLPVRWDEAIARCLRRDPGSRPARAADLLAQREPGRLRWGLALAAGAIALAVVAVAAVVGGGRAARGPAPVPVRATTGATCPPAVSRLAGVWDASTRARVAGRFEASPHAFVRQAWQAHARQFDAVAAAWSERWDRACAAADGLADPMLYGQRLNCLDNRRSELQWYVQGLDSPAVTVEELAIGSPGEFPLRPVAECDQEPVLRGQVPAPSPSIRTEVDAIMAEVHELRAVIRHAARLGRTRPPPTAALDRLAVLKARVEALGYLAGAGEIGWWLAEFLSWFDRFPESDRLADEVIDLAVRSRDDELLVRMRADQVSHRAQHAPTYDAAAGAAALADAETVAARVGRPPSLLAIIAEARVMHEQRAGTVEGVIAARLRLAALDRALGLPSFALTQLEQVATLRSRAGQHDEALRLARSVVAERQAIVGDAHPLMAATLLGAARVMARAGAVDDARAAATRAAMLFESIPGDRTAELAARARALAADPANAIEPPSGGAGR